MRLNGQGLRSAVCGFSWMLTLSGCATMTGSDETNRSDARVGAVTRIEKSDRRPLVFCGAVDPIRWSLKDTDATIAQAKALNAKWRALCAPEEESSGHAP